MKKKITVELICDSNDADAYISAEIIHRLVTQNGMFKINSIEIKDAPKEFHWYESADDLFTISSTTTGRYCPGYASTKNAINSLANCIYSDQSSFVDPDTLDKGYIIYLHFATNFNPVELKYGKVDCTDREIRSSLNLERLLLSREFGKLKY